MVNKNQAPGGESPNQFKGKPVSPSPVGTMSGPSQNARKREKVTKND